MKKCKCIKDANGFVKDCIYEYVIRNNGWYRDIQYYDGSELGFTPLEFDMHFVDIHLHRKKVIKKLLNM